MSRPKSRALPSKRCAYCGSRNVRFGCIDKYQENFVPACGPCAAEQLTLNRLLSVTDAVAIWPLKNERKKGPK